MPFVKVAIPHYKYSVVNDSPTEKMLHKKCVIIVISKMDFSHQKQNYSLNTGSECCNLKKIKFASFLCLK